MKQDNDRRRFLSNGITTAGSLTMGAVLGGCGANSSPAVADPCTQVFPSRKEVFVLLHGSWHGGWCWSKVRPLLQSAGYETLSPTFTGLGERARYGATTVGLSSHTEEIAKLLEFNDLNNVVLVGHSYAGIVLSGVAETLASRIKHLVYLDAFALNTGEAAFDFFPPEIRDLFINLAQTGNGWGFPPVPNPAEAFLGPNANTVDVNRINTLLTPMPVATHSEKLLAPLGNARSLARTYISCKRFPNLDPIKARVRTEPGWVYKELDTYHDCMLTMPNELSALLIEAAAR
jgi:pimeloyl-ACP methyl ester carboxylesterase